MADILSLYNQMNNFGRLLDMSFSVQEPGKVIYHLTISENLLATTKAAHGGVIAAFMDAIIGVAALSAVEHEQKLVSTVEFKINFLKPAMLNDELEGIGKVLQKGNRLVVTEGKVYNQNKELIATAIGTLNAYPCDKLVF